MNFLRVLTIGTRRRRIATVPDLAGAVTEGAAYLAQGASYSYIRARTAMMAPRLMDDPGFRAAMERCKWEGFAAAAGDLILIVEGDLRPHGAGAAPFWRRLYREVLAAEPVPEHRAGEGSNGEGSAGEGWADRIAEFDRRLEVRLVGPPAGVEAISEHSAGVIIDYAPVEDAIREVDREMVTNNVQFRFIEHVEALRRRADWPALAAAIRAAEGAAEGAAEAGPGG